MAQTISMILNWFVALKLEQECNYLPILWFYVTMFSPDFALVVACTVKGIVRDIMSSRIRVRFAFIGMLIGFLQVGGLMVGYL